MGLRTLALGVPKNPGVTLFCSATRGALPPGSPTGRKLPCIYIPFIYPAGVIFFTTPLEKKLLYYPSENNTFCTTIGQKVNFVKTPDKKANLFRPIMKFVALPPLNKNNSLFKQPREKLSQQKTLTAGNLIFRCVFKGEGLQRRRC